MKIRLCCSYIFICLVIISTSCKKERFTTDPSLSLEIKADTLFFDTVFTTTGSTSQIFKVLNNNDKGITINSIRLGGGAASPYKINVDGKPGPVVSNIDVLPNDSVYVFVTVTIDPNTARLPFVIRDSIAFEYNGNIEWVQLEAFGQNAIFLRDHVVETTETWNNDLPYVILGSLIVDTNAVLNIDEGARIHVHADAPLIINGSLKVNGNKWDSTRVIFSSDRLDEPYVNFPGSWPGIIFMDISTNNELNYAIIRNAYQAVIVNAPAITGTKLSINETIIENAYDIGLIGINTSINAKNLLVSNSGKNIVLLKGGNYNFTHCTAASFSNAYLQHKDPVLYLSNYILQNNIPIVADLNANFTNCIFWGEANGFVKDEVVVTKQGSTSFNVSFDHVLWRVQTPPAFSTSSNIIANQDPRFDSINTAKRFYSFRLDGSSPAIDKGKATSVIIDLDGNPRPVALPDLGAYEKQ